MPDRASAVGAQVVQVFGSNPRIWPTTAPDPLALTEFAAALRVRQLPLFIHAVYLINPASPDETLRARSTLALTHALVTAALAGADGVVTHLGSHRGEGFAAAAPLVARTLSAARAEAGSYIAGLLTADAREVPVVPPLLLETSAGSGATVGGTLDELDSLLGLLTDSREDDARPQYGLCLDTAHMFAAGWPVHDEQGLAALMGEFARRDLLQRVKLVHLNDSASLFASRHDRHANPGAGELGYIALARVVRHPAFAHVPFVLEVPGSDGHGPGRTEIEAVKNMRLEAPARPPLPGTA